MVSVVAVLTGETARTNVSLVVDEVAEIPTAVEFLERVRSLAPDAVRIDERFVFFLVKECATTSDEDVRLQREFLIPREQIDDVVVKVGKL